MDDSKNDAVDQTAVKGSVPAGGAGADSGSVEAVEVEQGDGAPIQNVGSMNDVPGVGTRGADDRMERGDGDKR